MSKNSEFKWRHQRQTSYLFFVLSASVAVMTVPAFQKHLPGAIIGLVAAIATAGLGFFLRKATARDADADLLRRSVTSISASGTLPLVKDMLPEALGVYPSDIRIPYLKRIVEDKAIAILEQRKPLLIVGSAFSGKTMMAVNLIRAHCGDFSIIIPETLSALRDLAKLAAPQKSVIWLDDLDRYIKDTAFDQALIEHLTVEGNVIVATLNSRIYASLQRSEDIEGYKAKALESFGLVVIRMNVKENAAHARQVEDVDISEGIRLYGVANYIGGLKAAHSNLTVLHDSDKASFEVLRAIADWQRTSLPFISKARLRQLIEVTTRLANDDVDRALGWLIETSEKYLPLIIAEGDNLSIPSYVLEYFDNISQNISPATWEAALNAATLEDLSVLGHFAFIHYRKDTIAEKAWRRSAESGDACSMHYLGTLLGKDRRRWEEAREWLEKAALAGCEGAYVTLASMLFKKKMPDEAVRWLEISAEKGHSCAMCMLGQEYETRKMYDEAHSWYKRSVDSGHSHGEIRLAQLMYRRKNFRSATDVLGKSQDPGAIDLLVKIGLDAYWRGEVQVAKQTFLKAKKSSHALFCAAAVQYEQGETRTALANFRQAADMGDSCAMVALGTAAISELRDEALAEQWYRRAAEYGDGEAMECLGDLYDKRHSSDKALFWYRGGARQGEPGAMYHLGRLMEERLEYDDAIHWYRRAARRRHIVAVENLIALLELKGMEIEASEWSRKQIKAVASTDLASIQPIWQQ